MDNDVVAGLDDAQRAAVLAPAGPVCVLAGAGTGKTRTITHRIAHLVSTGRYEAGQVLAVTFTTKAAGEMRHRLALLGAGGVQARTFHAAALRQLRFFWPRVIGGDVWPVLERKIRLVGAAVKRSGLPTDGPTIRDVASEIEWAKAMLIGPDEYLEAVRHMGRTTPVAAEKLAAVYARYESEKTAAAQLDFDDLLLHMVAILSDDEDAARQFRAQYRCFVVDEYQDVTPLQQRLLDAWLGGRDEVTVVGDANQTIYSFAGASPQYLLDFGRRYPQAHVIRLQQDYRSTPQVVGLANTVISAARGPAAAARLTLRAMLPDGPAATFEEYPDERAEADATAAAAARLIAEGTPASAIAILYRINAQSEVFEQALATAGVPHVVRGGERFFTRRDVREALEQLFRAAGRAPEETDGVGLVDQVRAVLTPLGLTAQPPQGGAQRERWEALGALLSVAEELLAVDSQADLTVFVAELRRRAEAQHSPTIDAVTLASMHAAKGLEWDAVFLVGLVDGTMPIQHATEPDDIEEERRLLYVGITRARTRLALSWATARHPGGRRSRRPSRFLTDVIPAHLARPSKGSRRCAVCGGALGTPPEVKLRRCAACPSTADPALVDALRQWRLERSQEDSVPAFVVFSDATMIAIAERRPVDDRALLSVPGIGRAKLERYGAEILELITQVR